MSVWPGILRSGLGQLQWYNDACTTLSFPEGFEPWKMLKIRKAACTSILERAEVQYEFQAS
jgi:hypothetical protein